MDDNQKIQPAGSIGQQQVVMDNTPKNLSVGGNQQQPGDYQQMYKGGGRFKEQLEAIAGSFSGRGGGGVETEPIRRTERPIEAVEEIPTSPEVEKKPELAGYVEKVEREAETMKPIVDDYTQQILLSAVDPASVKVKLPLTADEVEKGLHHQVWESVRWLAEWCMRQMKMLGGRAEYKQE